MRTFNQKKFFTNFEFRITESKLYCNITKFGDGNEIDVPYENLEGDKVSFKSSNGFALVISLILFTVALLTIIDSFSSVDKRDPYLAMFWAFLGTIMLVVYLVTKKDLWKIKLSNGSFLLVHKQIPNKEQTNEFLSELMETRNNYLKENYAQIDENLNYESQLSNLRWLKSINAITKDEFEQKYFELKKSIKPEKLNIGFGK